MAGFGRRGIAAGLVVLLAPAAAASAQTDATPAVDLRYVDAPRIAADRLRSELEDPRGAGDVNGDGRPDVVALLDSRGRRRRTPRLRVLFLSAPSDAVRLSRQRGFDIRFPDDKPFDIDYGAAGDVNADGLADVVVTHLGTAYVVYGRASEAAIHLDALGEGGFVVTGLDVEEPGARSRLRAAGFSAGDMNADGVGDVVVGSPGSDPGGRSQAGSAFVVYGSRQRGDVDVRALGDRGFRIEGAAAGDRLGLQGAPLGDVDGDGRADIGLAGGQGTDAPDDPVWVVLGPAAGVGFDLSQPLGSAYRISGAGGPSATVRLTGAGDVNGDGRADMVIGSDGRGVFHLVYGSTAREGVDVGSPHPRVVGFTESGGGALTSDVLAGPGDLTGDGFADLLLGGYFSGVWLVRGAADLPPSLDLGALGERGAHFPFINEASRIGDVDGDGVPETLLGGPEGFRCHPFQGTGGGSAYLVPGASFPPVVPPHARYSRNSDRLVGTGDDDVVFGARGDDRIRGRAGHDCLTGGEDDYYEATESHYAPRPDKDRLFGGTGRDVLDGGAVADLVSGGPGADLLYGGYGEDRVLGGRGDDYLLGEMPYYVDGDFDVFAGGPGDDRIFALDSIPDRVRCGPGRDRVEADPFDRLRDCERVRRVRDQINTGYPLFD